MARSAVTRRLDYSKKQHKNCLKFLETSLKYTDNAFKEFMDLLNLKVLRKENILIWRVTS